MKNLINLLVLILTFSLVGCASMGSGTNDQKRQQILEMRDQVLAELYQVKPDTRAQLNAAPGYAVFSNANLKLFVVAGGTGYGVVSNSQTGKNTYMNMVEGGVGLGLGGKDYRIVMVFHNRAAINHFIQNGWTFGGNADATAKAGNKGVSVEGESYFGDVTVYTFTKSGLALQATIKGTKFWVDSELNR